MTIRPRNDRTEEENKIDAHVGKRIKLRRTIMAVSQEKLGKACGITFQQVQKYESGGNRVSASRLCQIAEVLTCHPVFFFEGLEFPAAGVAVDPSQSNAALELVRLFIKLDEAGQDAAMQMLRVLNARPTSAAA